MADNLTPMPVKTKTDGDVAVDIAQYNGTTVGASNAIHVQPGTGINLNTQDVRQATASNLNAEVQGDAAHDAAVSGNPVLVGGYASAAAPSDVSADGDAVRAWFLRNGARVVNLAVGGTLITGDATNGLDVDVTRVTGTVTVDSELPAAAALADNTANPTVPAVGGFLMGYDGTDWDRVRVANTGRLQVDVVTGGGTDTPTNPVTDPKTSASLAAGGSVDVDSTDVGTATKKLKQVIMTASVPFKAILKKVSNGSATTVGYFFGQAMQTVTWDAPHKNYVTQGDTGASFCGFRVSFTNMDNNDAADVYATFMTEE